MPPELIKSFVLIKRAIAKVNEHRGYDSKKVEAIEKACDEILQEKIGLENFPLVIYQTGSGT
jgi:fumarate hydratase class II